MYVEQLANTEILVEVTKDIFGHYQVQFKNCEVKQGGLLIGEYGSGETVEEAARNYIRQIAGETLVFDASGEGRKEIKIFFIEE